jgi:phosphoglycolate phosphatase
VKVLLDLDGTLTDPAEGICASLRHAMAAMKRSCPEDSVLRRYIGPPLHETFADLLASKDAKEIAVAIAFYRERFGDKGMYENAVYPGIPEALKALGEGGARLFLATSKPRVFAERILEHFNLAAHFAAVYGSELDGTRTNKADLIAYLLSSESMQAQDACMVGDRSHDVIGAKANGMRAIGALWGYGSRDELVSAGAAALCERPALLPEAVR